jgi:hypothetical protein
LSLASVAYENRLPLFNRKKRNEKQVKIMVDPLQIGLGETT